MKCGARGTSLPDPEKFFREKSVRECPNCGTILHNPKYHPKYQKRGEL